MSKGRDVPPRAVDAEYARLSARYAAQVRRVLTTEERKYYQQLAGELQYTGQTPELTPEFWAIQGKLNADPTCAMLLKELQEYVRRTGDGVSQSQVGDATVQLPAPAESTE